MRSIIFMCALVAVTIANEDNLNNILTSSIQDFTAKMFAEVASINSGKNCVLSAFSVMPPLAQLAIASEGPSHDEILKTIGLPDNNVTKDVFAFVTHKLPLLKGVELKIANRLYVSQEAELNIEFAALTKEIFDSDTKMIDFSEGAQSAAEINTWVEEHTNKRIKDLVQPQMFDEATGAVLVNAIYFKGIWKNPFNETLTKDRDFHVSKEKVVKIPTMSAKKSCKYGESAELGAKLLELPYEGDESSLLLILPNEVDGLAALEKNLNNKELLNKALSDMYSTTIQVFIPKFKIETTINLRNVLNELGIKKLFTDEAHLTKLVSSSPYPIGISSAIQKAFIEVNEEGTEAAAANAIAVQVSLFSDEFKADRPFYFAIRIHGKDAFNGHFVG